MDCKNNLEAPGNDVLSNRELAREPAVVLETGVEEGNEFDESENHEDEGND